MSTLILPNTNIQTDVSLIGSPSTSVPIVSSIPASTVISPSWIAVTYASPWLDSALSGYSGSQYYKDAAGIVHVIVSAKCSSPPTGAGTTIFTLPAGYRPPASNLIAAYIDTGTVNYCKVQSDGQVVPLSGGATVTLCFFHFPGVG